MRRRLEWLTIAALLCASLSAVGFVVFYVTLPDNHLLGLTLGLAFAFVAVAAIVAGKRLVPQDKADEEYHEFGEPDVQREVVEDAKAGADGISRRTLIAGATATAGLTLGAALAIPVSSLGPNVGDQVSATPWRRGRRLVKENDDPLRLDEVVSGTFFPAYPEGADRRLLGSPVILVRVPEERLELPVDRRRAAPEGVIAFSKICTHAGCAVSMYRHPKFDAAGEPEDALVCPCHYSTFDPARGGLVVFGPAGRPLPQLPLEVDADGVLVAGGNFFDHVGPST
jgi:ubiquinol-cytochrome c reductase iron-sulfur subunit